MKNLIVYASKHGTVKKCAELLKMKLKGETHLYHVKDDKIPSVLNYDQIIIGGSIHMGHIQTDLELFMANEGLHLMTKRLGLFLCCALDGDDCIKQFNIAFPEGLRATAFVKSVFGGEFNTSQMTFLERILCRKLINTSTINKEIKFLEIDRFACEVNHEPIKNIPRSTVDDD